MDFGKECFEIIISFVTVPPAPMDLMVRSADESSITVEWTEPDPPHGIILNYDISYWPTMEVETPATEETDIGVTSLSYRIEGLLTNVTYSIKVSLCIYYFVTIVIISQNC